MDGKDENLPHHPLRRRKRQLERYVSQSTSIHQMSISATLYMTMNDDHETGEATSLSALDTIQETQRESCITWQVLRQHNL
mmetsp:Transcript_55816/g.135230  ORF Transcript_55816/g.135230 Transcript_55816/m.135230 type:complete len:81 (-) Transcript_55816:428-670(-)